MRKNNERDRLFLVSVPLCIACSSSSINFFFNNIANLVVAPSALIRKFAFSNTLFVLSSTRLNFDNVVFAVSAGLHSITAGSSIKIADTSMNCVVKQASIVSVYSEMDDSTHTPVSFYRDNQTSALFQI